MKKIYINGKIYVDKEHFEESMLISDGIIVALGTNEELMKHEVDEVVDSVADNDVETPVEVATPKASPLKIVKK